MTQPIEVSVVIPTFHREQQLVDAVRSVLSQEGVVVEVIVVDDSPEGSARDVINALADPRVHYLLRQQPSGGRPALVRNEGASRAQGEYLYFLDDDDLLEVDALKEMLAALKPRPDAGMAFGVVSPFGENQAVLAQQQHYFREARRIALRLHSARQFQACMTYRSPVMICSACLGRRSAFEACGGFDTAIPLCEDSELWARLAGATGFVFLDRSVVRYRTGASSLMHDLNPQDTKLSDSYRIIQGKFKNQVGALPALVWKFWVHLILR
jgi:GT2 family glycosyltransferase